MQKKYFKSLIILFIVLATFFGFFVNAQIRNTDVILNISPEYPGPNQNTNAVLSSHVVNLDKANISWFINGQKMIEAIGKKSFSFRTEGLGSTTDLSATIDTVDGQSISKKMTLTIADMDLLWEAYDSYTPPFYKGKALAPSQGKFKVVAIPNLVNQGNKVNTNNLSYVWKKDGNSQLDSSGWGKNYFIFQNSYLDKDNTVEVAVSDIGGGTNTSKRIILKTSEPKILFYEDDPKLGVKWENSLNDGYTISRDGKILVAEPYFFSPQEINSSSLVFSWFLNGNKIQTPDIKNILAIKPEAGQSGSSIIKLMVENTDTLFQSITKQIQVNF